MNNLDTGRGRRAACFAALALMLPALLAPARAQEGGKEDPASIAKRMTSLEGVEGEFDDEDLKAMEEMPRGKFGYGWLFDAAQSKDPSAPVAVGGIQSLFGGGRYRSVVKIKRVALRNRGAKAVSSVGLGWAISGADDREKVLAEGALPPFAVRVGADSYEVVEVPVIYPALLLRAVAKDGEVNGSFTITIGVREARFADGSLWRRR